MNQFHNPYHFVPVSGTIDDKDDRWKKVESMRAAHVGEPLPHGGHSRYRNDEDHCHGRIICKLTTETPIFIGAKREKASDDAPAKADPYLLNGQPAIPASSLRGMISAIAEAAGSSALRVLEDRALTRRMSWKKRESLQAIGLLCKIPGENELKLLPLIMPVYPCDQKGRLKKNTINKIWQDIFQKPNLKVYLDAYKQVDKKLSYRNSSFLNDKKPKAFSADNREYWYLKLATPAWENGNLIVDNPKVKKIKENVFFLSGQYAADGKAPIPEAEFNTKTKEEKKKYTRGILRVLGIDGRQTEIPKEKTHEIFIPFPDDIEVNKLLNASEAINRFHILADERTKADEYHPFELKGSTRNRNPKQFGSRIRLKDKDIVFFDTKDGETVSEISISSIWRRGAGGTVHQYFASIINEEEHKKEILPFHPGRKLISPAEMVFGFVENRDENQKKNSDKQALAYKSRIRFSTGCLVLQSGETDPWLDPIPLKILDSPKPPSPALYFKKKNAKAGYIAKDALNPDGYIPQGRKFYLHKYGKDIEAPWETKQTSGKDAHNKQKAEITPLRDKLTFYFHIDFENLSPYELRMLCYALKPDPAFQHKIGMGKPLGLGSIRIDPVGIFYVDRDKRYAGDNPFESGRYHLVSFQKELLEKLPEQYAAEKNTGCVPESEKGFEKRRELFIKTMNPKIHQAIKQIGIPDKVEYPVRYPHSGDDIDTENKLYEWFVNNDEKPEQFLKPLPAENGKLPHLKSNKKES